jgi:energy-coupling factor transporter transmembrane protein EcfT
VVIAAISTPVIHYFYGVTHPIKIMARILAIIVYHQTAARVTVQVIVMVSFAALLITANTVRHNIVPALEALKMPASVKAPVPTPAP